MDSLNILRQGITDIADAVRKKTGGTSKIPFSQLPSVIDSITEDVVLQEKTITENGEYTADSGYTGLGKVTVNVDIEPTLQEKTVTENGEVIADEGFDGLSKVIVNVNTVVPPPVVTPSVEGGYTINFYDTNDVLFESHSAQCGRWIDKPLNYEVHHWQNDNGHINQFPLTVGSDGVGSVVDLYPAIIGESACYIINPNGTDFGTTFLKADGTAQSGYKDNHGNGGFHPRYDENGYTLQKYADSGATKYAKLTLNDAIKCEEYRYLKVKWYYLGINSAGSDSGSFYIRLNKDVDCTGNYKSLKIAGGTVIFTTTYYRDRCGSDWTESATLNDLNNAGWHWSVMDISDLTEFYFTVEGSYNAYIAEVVMTK